ncbi:MAG: pyridoxine 5'-phosphate synthase [Omnitrophica WOR_2 bacterium RIFCSPLOWO2_12_FULL_50_9]|nr:MAG: pyridoxine 5'-phosphate synthase [Omnitrophica WOR_2 bacterium RIFCSPHIGHO2_02_FULL_50_17]OGX40509.1 MAG: pyridoxine 5'-phosphate synthase [Omnitrophica WOR_2 bacterium RIFCSPLOWO2_12_FULL_50_9]
MPKLGVNIDHVATLRQARREFDPDPVEAARLCEEAGADSIVAHLREDRRHMNEQDIRRLHKIVKTRFNLEMSLNKEIVRIAVAIKPDQATLVPERREEITTEGGLDIVRYFRRIRETAATLREAGIAVSLFVDPVKKQIQKSQESGVGMIELHTGRYALAETRAQRLQELKTLRETTQFARSLGLVVNAGHGLKYHNVAAVARIPGIEELNIGHSIISHAVFTGLERAVREMKEIVR